MELRLWHSYVLGFVGGAIVNFGHLLPSLLGVIMLLIAGGIIGRIYTLKEQESWNRREANSEEPTHDGE